MCETTLRSIVFVWVLCLLAPCQGNLLLSLNWREQLVNRSGAAHTSCEPWRVPVAERCAYVIEHADACYPDGGLQAYLKVHYCDVPHHWRWASILALLLAVLLLFGALLIAAERFFCPATELISDYLKLPPAVAGATLLSFGNGAPDVFMQLAAVKQSEGRPAAVGLALSEPLGGGLFVSNVVFGLVVLLSSKHHKVLVQRKFFLKDLGFYLLAVCIMFICLWDEQMHLWEACLLAAVYVVYVVVTFYISRGEEPVHAEMQHHELRPDELLSGGLDVASEFGSLMDYAGPDAMHEDAEDGLQEPLLPSVPQPRSPVPVATPRCCSPFTNGPQHDAEAEAQAADSAALSQYQSLATGGKSVTWHLQQQQHHQQPGVGWKYAVQRPFLEVLSCTMPRVGSSHVHRYVKWRASLLPVTLPLFVLITQPGLFEVLGWAGVVYGALCGTVGSMMVWAMYPCDHIPAGMLKGVFSVLTFMVSILWLNTAASALVGLCVVLGHIFGVKPALLGATVLAWGNSAPDMVADLSMARDGFPTMAIAACFASPMFTLLVGMSCSMAYGAWLHGGTLPLVLDKPLEVMYVFTIVNLIKYMILVPWVFNYRLGKRLAILALVFYVCYNIMYGLAIAGVL